jgi:hypothetical protein
VIISKDEVWHLFYPFFLFEVFLTRILSILIIRMSGEGILLLLVLSLSFPTLVSFLLIPNRLPEGSCNGFDSTLPWIPIRV